jgi:glycosyltransferase involved in cell wall biosynthesis
MEASTLTGPAKNLLRFCRQLAASDPRPAVRMSVITFLRGASPGRSNQFIDAVRAQGIPIEVIPERFLFDWTVAGALRKVLAQLRPDIVQTHGIKSHCFVRFLRPDMRWLAYHHGYTYENLKVRMYNHLDRWSLPGADKVVTVCGPFAQVLKANGVRRERIHILPNSIEPAARATAADAAQLRANLGIASEERVILAIGRFSSEKGHLDLIAAFAELQRRQPALPLRLVLVGDGLDRQLLERSVQEQGLTGPIVFTGHQREVQAYYAMADTFVLPSHSEGSPNVLLEAMMANLPIVATRVGGIPETVEHEVSALLVPPRNPQALAGAIERLLSNRELAEKLAGNAYCAVASRFSPEQYKRSLTAIYAELCPEKAPAEYKI